jgi:GNAT superfamily N-acetyltransferase
MDDIAAIESITRNCYLSFADAPRFEVIDDPSMFAVLSYLSIPFFSGVARTTLESGDVEAAIERLREKRCSFRWWVTPSTRPSGLGETLCANGFRHAYDAPGMIAHLAELPLDAPPPHGIEIRRLTEVRELNHWFDVFAPVFSRPESERAVWCDAYAPCSFRDDAPWQHFVAYEGETPLATTTLLLHAAHEGGEVAGIYHVATVPSARGRGIGAAVTRAAMLHARNAGASRAALQSSESGYNVYRSLGFEQRCVVSAYEWVSQP